MLKEKELSIETHPLIIITIRHHKASKSNPQTSQELKLNNTTVDYNIKKYLKSDSLVNKRRSGRPRITSSAEHRSILVNSNRSRQKGVSRIVADINTVQLKSAAVTKIKLCLSDASLQVQIGMKRHLN